jgi:hypothetical protein
MHAASGVIPVVLSGGQPASGLADMLQQFIEQTLADSPRKALQARRLVGGVVLCAAEDERVRVRITFAPDRIELHDGAVPSSGEAMMTADFLTIAHLTSGQENPFWLLARRKLNARFSVPQLPFLLGVLRFMQIRSESPRVAWTRWAWTALAAAAAAGVLYWYVTPP